MRVLGLLVVAVGCANNVPQDRSTGPDGRLKGATPLTFENGEARTKGIVTYPGGDRIDWRIIELPEKQKGTLDLQLTWKTPRPGLQVAFDVFDEWNRPIVAASGGRRGGRTRTATINDAIGKYFVRIYAPKRGDAGAYVLKASFEPQDTTGGIDIRTLPIPDPPKLAAVPEPDPDCPTFDPQNKACHKSCPFDAPEGWKGCKERDEKKQKQIDADARAAARATCLANAPKELRRRIIHVEVSGDTVNVKIDVGTDDQALLDTGWSAKVLQGDTEKVISSGATVSLRSVGKQITRGSSGLTVDQLNSNPWVRLTPPPPSCP
jgi:hypothetical protein